MITGMCHCSDVVVQIVDARNPLLFYCKDLVKIERSATYCIIIIIIITIGSICERSRPQ